MVVEHILLQSVTKNMLRNLRYTKDIIQVADHDDIVPTMSSVDVEV